MEKAQQKEFIKLSAKKGTFMGLYFIVLMGMMFAMPYYGLLFLPVLAMIIYVPFYVYKWFKSLNINSSGTIPASVLWSHGVLMFFCGSLIMAIGIYIFFRFLSPDYIVNLMDYYEQMAQEANNREAMLQVGEMRQLVAQVGLPRAIDMAFSFSSLSVLSGAVLSLILSIIVKSIPVNR